MKNKKLIIGIVIAVIILIVGYFAWRAWKIKKRQEALTGVTQSGSTPVSGTGGGGPPIQYSDAFPLRVGSKGNNVTALQYAINEGCPEITTKIAVDGDFGPQTEAASDVCLTGQTAHVKGQVAYSEYQWLTKRISFSQDQQIKQGCQASTASRAMMLTFWGVDCDKYGY